MTMSAISQLNPRAEDSGDVRIVIDTPRGSRNKYAFDEKIGLFQLRHVLPAGAVFPFDFGFIPGTSAEDGDPVDSLLLMDEPTFAGCVVAARLIGAIAAEQTQDGKKIRNDRLIAVATEARTHQDVTSIDQLSKTLLDEVEHFFVSYNEMRGRKFSPIGRFGPDHAEQLLEAGIRSRSHRKAHHK